jgi:uncharacterized protein
VLILGYSEIKKNECQLGTWIFYEICLEDKLLFQNYIEDTEYQATVWSSNFAYLYAASQSNTRKTLWKIIDGLLVPLLYNKKHQIIYPICLPFGKGDPEHVVDVLYKCMVYCYKYNQENARYTKVRTINEDQLQFLKGSKRFEKYFRLKKLLGVERHYSIQKLINLSGKEFLYVRRKINKFRRNYPNAIIREYKPSDYDLLMDLNRTWNKTAGQKYSSVFDGTYYREILKRVKELDHLVLVVEIDGKIVGMTSGGVLPTGQSWTCLRKADHSIEGLSELLLVELAKASHQLNPEIEYMNDGSDLADEGLCFFKERFRPELNLHRYRIHLL